MTMSLPDLRPQAVRRTPEQLVEHLKSFNLDPKFSAGIWFFSPSDSRFHEKYGPDLAIEQRLETARGLKEYGLAGLEAHYPNEINEENEKLWRDFCVDTGIRLVTVVPLLFRSPQFEFGSLSSPLPEARKAAIDLTRRALDMNCRMDTDFCVVWPGIDGYENPFGIDFATMRDRFAEGLAAAMDMVPGVRVAFEPKPYEPRGRIIFGTTPEGMLLCRMVEERLQNPENRRLLVEGHALVGLNPEVGHALMAYEDLPYAYSWPLSEGRLCHMHLNSQPLGNFDQDLNVGTVSPEQTEALLYVLKMHGYRAWFGIDISPERMPVDVALRISMDAVRAANDRINEMDHESILRAVNHPDKARGWLEGYLVRVRASYPERLAPLPPVWPQASSSSPSASSE
jgi:xylose isomerase